MCRFMIYCTPLRLIRAADLESKGQPALTELMGKLRDMTNMPLNGMCYQRGGNARVRRASDVEDEWG